MGKDMGRGKGRDKERGTTVPYLSARLILETSGQDIISMLSYCRQTRNACRARCKVQMRTQRRTHMQILS